MNHVQFSYSITPDDYAHAHVLIWRKFPKSTWNVVMFFGVLLCIVPFFREPDGSLNCALLGLPVFGLVLIYKASQAYFPSVRARRHYPHTGLAGRQFACDVSDEAIAVKGRDSEWKYAWPAILLAEESPKMFMLYTGLQIFPFAKRFLTPEQTESIQRLIAAQPGFAGGAIPKY